MKVVLVALALVAVASAASIEGPGPVKGVVAILRSLYDLQPEGAYRYGFESEDGIKREETGELKTVTNEENKPQDVVVVRGSYNYIDEEGNLQTIRYEADEFGFRAFGPSIPQPVSAQSSK